MGDLLSFLGAWLITYILHSTLLLGGIALLEHLRFVRSVAYRETLWRVALVGGLMTTTFHCSPEIAGMVGLQKWKLGNLAEAVTQKTPAKAIYYANSTRVVNIASKTEAGSSNMPIGPADLTYASSERIAFRLTITLALVWSIGMLTNIFRLVWLGLQAQSELKNRVVVYAPFDNDFHTAPDVKSAKLPTLSVAPNLNGPISLPNREIVVPEWVMDSLSPKHRQAIYAHELAHQLRGDPMVLLLLHLLNAIVWIQPLHRLARQRLIHLAELQADAWASQKCSDPRSLAECLLICAERISSSSQVAFGSAFSSQGALVERVERLLDGTDLAKPGRSYAVQFAAVLSVVVALFFLPGCDVDSKIAYRTGEKVSVTKHDHERKGEVTIRRTNLLVKLTHQGKLQLTEGNHDVDSLEAGGKFVFEESQGSTKRVYTVTSNINGELERSFLLNGKSTSIDDGVRAWLANALSRTVRESGF